MESPTTSPIKQEIAAKDSVNDPRMEEEEVTPVPPAPDVPPPILLCLACGVPVSPPQEMSEEDEANSKSTLLRCFLKLFGGTRRTEMDHEHFKQLSFCSLCNQELVFLMNVQEKLKELQKALQRSTKEMRQKLEVSESRFQSAGVYEQDEHLYKIRRRILGDKIVVRSRKDSPLREADSETGDDANLTPRKSSDLEAKHSEIRRSERRTKGKSKSWKLNTPEVTANQAIKVDSEYGLPVPVVKVSAAEKADADMLIPEHIKVEVDIEEMLDEEEPFEEDPEDEDYSPESPLDVYSESESEHSENSDNDNSDYSEPAGSDDDSRPPPKLHIETSPTKNQGRTKGSGPKQPLVCSYCEKEFKTSDKLKRHVMTHTGERPNKCSLCEKAFIRSTSLRHHIMRIHQNDRPHQCGHCECAYSTRDHLARHLFKAHGIEKEMSSNKSGKSQRTHPTKEKKSKLDSEERARLRKRTAKGIYNTEKVKEDPGSGNCHYLEVEFEKFEEDKYRCMLCAEIVSSHATIKNHVIRAHTDRFVCGKCGQHKASRSDLNKHVREVHEKKPRKPIVMKKECPICGKPFGHKSALEFHLVTHYSEEEKREVEARGEKLKTQGKRVQCGVCGAVFNSVTWLKIHEKTKHPVTESDKAEFQRVCPHCGKSFSEAYFGRHMERYHSGVDPDLLKSFVCSFCDRKFFTSQKLHNHRKIHTGERPFSCDLCSKSFTTKVLLKHHHMRNHENRRPHKCHLCQAAFITKDHLNRHVAGVHEGKKQQTKSKSQQNASQIIEHEANLNLVQFLE